MNISDQTGWQAGFIVWGSVEHGHTNYIVNTQFSNMGTQNGYQFTTPGILQMPEDASSPAAVWVTIYSPTQTP